MRRFDGHTAIAFHEACRAALNRSHYIQSRVVRGVPEKSLGTTVLFAVNVTVTDIGGWFWTLAAKVISALSAPVTLLQSTLRNTRCSGEVAEIEPLEGEISSQEALLLALKVNGVGPPALTSTKRLPAGTNGSREIEGLGQPYPSAQLFTSSPGLQNTRYHTVDSGQ